MGWQAYKRTIARPFNMRIYNDLLFRAYPDSHEPGRLIYFRGLPDYNEMVFMQRYLRTGDQFIDGGAHIGIYSLLAASIVGSSGGVDAFEPAPAEVRRLRENVALSKLSQVRVHEAALGDRPGSVHFTIDRGEGNRIQTEDDADRGTREVPMTILDQVLSGIYAMAKLDLEGAEFLALRGAEQHVAARNPPVWLIELVDHFIERFGGSCDDVVDWLAARGYDLVNYDADSNLLQVEGREFVGSQANVLFVHTEALSTVQARLTGAVEHF
jgi:FkbM family methyltransferase